MESRWTVKKDGKPMATMYPDDVVRQMAKAGYKTYVDGKIYRAGKK